MTMASWNGEHCLLEELRVPVRDRSFFFGDAVYEVIRVYDRKAFLLEEHFARLDRSLQELGISTDVGAIREQNDRLLASSGLIDGYLYLQVSRGAANRAHHFPVPAVPANVLVYAQDVQGDPYGRFRETGISAITYPDIRWQRRDIKSVNLLGNCLAKQAAEAKGCQEAIFIEENGEVTEASSNNAFIVIDGEIVTRPLSHKILPGITRAFVLGLAGKLGIPVREKIFSREMLFAAREIFLTGTFTEVVAVSKLDDRTFGKPDVAARLWAEYRRVIG